MSKGAIIRSNITTKLMSLLGLTVIATFTSNASSIVIVFKGLKIVVYTFLAIEYCILTTNSQPNVMMIMVERVILL